MLYVARTDGIRSRLAHVRLTAASFGRRVARGTPLAFVCTGRQLPVADQRDRLDSYADRDSVRCLRVRSRERGLTVIDARGGGFVPDYTRVLVLGVEIDALTMDQSVERAEELIEAGGLHHHAVVNAGKLVLAQDDVDLRQALEAAAIVNADGQSVVWASRVLGEPLPERVAGIDFMDHLLARAAQRGWPVYFLGARDQVVRAVVEAETRRHPGLIVAGARNGYWTTEEESAVVSGVEGSGARILFVALPSPQKEWFVARHRGVLDDLLVVGVGGSFDVVAGVTKRAPEAWQRLGMEWAYRFVQEPGRMWKRYLVGNTRFIGLTGGEFIRRRNSRRRSRKGMGIDG